MSKIDRQVTRNHYDLEQPSNDLNTAAFTTPYPSDYWLTFRSSKLSERPGRFQSAINRRMISSDDVNDDDCVQPETETAVAELGSLPRQQTSTNFADVSLRFHADQKQLTT